MDSQADILKLIIGLAGEISEDFMFPPELSSLFAYVAWQN